MMNRAFWDAIFLITGSLFTYGTSQDNSTIVTNSTMTTTPPVTTTTTTVNVTTSSTTTTSITTTTTIPVKKFVAAAVRSHFDDCPDSHSHFCFHGTCRFLILEETPACVCHQGFVGMRCEHADLLAVVATNHRQQTVATVLVLCVIGCVLTMLLCTLLHCWWRRDGLGRRHRLHCAPEKQGSMLKGRGSCCHSESVV
ncbi:protransforming growth factor alpha [Salvelinus alpinus]|uniref:protransforming growth factor alpha-like n=1 Tax=Salvelinus sp. IW2-2015 TaxID=2691554 RepID=UPI000CDFD112|nr:protransforming growth factor alpha-like [Salvelinus alpinus]